jgi:SOS-response transcriptional repressor LexA
LHSEDLKVYLKTYEVLENGQLKPVEETPTNLIIVENVENFKENTFWLKIKNLWVLVGKVPPLSIQSGDIILFKEKGKWGMFRFIEKKEDTVILSDVKGKKKTKVKEENFTSINILGKVIRIQDKV